MQEHNIKNARIGSKSNLAPRYVASSVNVWLTQHGTRPCVIIIFIVNWPLVVTIMLLPTTILVFVLYWSESYSHNAKDTCVYMYLCNCSYDKLYLDPVADKHQCR